MITVMGIQGRSHLLMPLARILLSQVCLCTILATCAIAEESETKKELVHPDEEMEQLIQDLEQYEKLYDNLDVTLQRTKEYHLEKWTIPKTVETIRAVWQPDLFFAERSELHHFFDDKQRTDRSVVIYDGKKTTAIEYGNTANVLQRRYVPSYVFPPHTWAIVHLEVNFPLSVYLRGTEAMQQHPKVRRLPKPTGSIFEIGFAKSKYLEEDDFNRLKCAKVRVEQRSREEDTPIVHILWLAREHNLLCVKSQALMTIQGKQHVWTESQIDAVREISDGVFVPQKVSIQRYDYGSLPEGKHIVGSEESLLVKSVQTDVDYSPEDFEVESPLDLPTYVLSNSGELVDSPHHPVSTGMPNATTLEAIINAVRVAEEEYKDFDFSETQQYRPLHAENSTVDGGSEVTVSMTENIRCVHQGVYEFFKSVGQNQGVAGGKGQSAYHEVIDGEYRRFWYFYANDGPDSNRSSRGLISLDRSARQNHLRPHWILLGSLNENRKLWEVLESVWYDPRESIKVRMEYVDDEVIDGEVCHRIRRNLLDRDGNVTSQHEMWIAPERNYMPARTQWVEFRKSDQLPTGIHVVTSWQRLPDGHWMPREIMEASFEWLSRSGLSEGRIIHQWQRNIEVSEATLTPQVDDDLFSKLRVPAQTKVTVQNATGMKVLEFETQNEQLLELTEEQLKVVNEFEPAEPDVEANSN